MKDIDARLMMEALQKASEATPPPEDERRPGVGKSRPSALMDPERWVDCPECEAGKLPDGSTCEHCDGTGRHPKPANEGESLDDWNDSMERENEAGYIQIDLYTGGVQTISLDEVEQATRELEHIPSGEGVSDWDAWKGEEYMVVAVPKVVQWPQTAAYQHQPSREPVPDHSDLIQPTKY
jgi:hypothetical protein